MALKREVREELGITDFVPETVLHYVFESAREKELVYRWYNEKRNEWEWAGNIVCRAWKSKGKSVDGNQG